MNTAALLLSVLLSYWPGGDGRYAAEPTYAHRIPVIDTIGVRDHRAFREWNACGSVQLVDGTGLTPDSPGTITIHDGLDDLPRGGWAGDHGVLFLPDGPWQRLVPIIRHELGHALGFGHTSRWSVMGGSSHVQAVDCNGLRNYYGL